MSVKSSCLVNSAGDVWVVVVQEAAIAVLNPLLLNLDSKPANPVFTQSAEFNVI